MNHFELSSMADGDNELTIGGLISYSPGDVILLTAGDQLAQLVVTGKKNGTLRLPAGQTRLFCAARQATIQVQTGSLRCRRFCQAFFAKLLAFLDEASGRHKVARTVAWAWLAAPVVAFRDRRTAEYWLLQHALARTATMAPLLTLLRQSEAYSLVRFLLAPSCPAAKLADLAKKYGLSYSHFRRVAKEALGDNVKSELKSWRAARSLLEMVESRHNLTDIALKHGYASSSHFSTEIKHLLGVSPRNLTDVYGSD